MNLRWHNHMKTSFFDYELPQNLIAQNPASPRDACKLMILDKVTSTITNAVFSKLGSYLNSGDVLVFNDSRVIPARIIFLHNGREVEIFLTRKLSDVSWLAIGKPGKILQKGAFFDVGEGLKINITDVRDDGQRVLVFSGDLDSFNEKLHRVGRTPLPPYIKNSSAEFSDYQTVYAREEGSVAAPTAGLHFTQQLLAELKQKGVQLLFVTLHIGLGTFLPIKSENVEDHVMHSEFFSISSEAAGILNVARKSGRRIIAVGTTSVRVLESNFNESKGFSAGYGETSIYIYPGYVWKCVDGLITNFHLPKSTLLLLTCSFGGPDFVLKAYSEAVIRKYRFYSFGDAMLIV